jgi:hypothetical protein
MSHEHCQTHRVPTEREIAVGRYLPTLPVIETNGVLLSERPVPTIEQLSRLLCNARLSDVLAALGDGR